MFSFFRAHNLVNSLDFETIIKPKHAYQILCAEMATIHYVSTMYISIARLSGKSMNAWLSKTVNGSFTTKQNNTFRLNFPSLYHMIMIMIFILPCFIWIIIMFINYSFLWLDVRIVLSKNTVEKTRTMCAPHTHTHLSNFVQTWIFLKKILTNVGQSRLSSQQTC